MSSESVQFEHGPQTYRIQYEVLAPPPRLVKRMSQIPHFMPPPEFKVASIRVTEITADARSNSAMQILIFGRGFATPALARSGATAYAKRIIREQLARKLVALPAVTPAV